MATSQGPPAAPSNLFHDKLDGFIAGISSKRNSSLLVAEARGDPDRERELREEDQDRIAGLSQQKYLQSHVFHPMPPPGTYGLLFPRRCRCYRRCG